MHNNHYDQTRIINTKNKSSIITIARAFICVSLLLIDCCVFSSCNNNERNYSFSDVKGNPLSDNYIPESDSIKYDDDNQIYYADDEIIIITEKGTSENQIKGLIDEIGGTNVGTIPSIDLYQIRLNEKHSLAEMISLCDEIINNNSFVQYATYDSSVECGNNSVEAIAPKDEWKSDVDENDWKDTDVDGTNWWLEAIDAPKAWTYNNRMKKIQIGISDNSFDTGHEDLKNKCSFPNKVLESRNDATLWWLDNKRDYDPVQYNAHGTHVAGIIGAEHNNEKGISGIVPNCDILLAPQYANDNANEFLEWDSSIYANLSYLVNAHCKIINYSQGKAKWTQSGYSDSFIKREGDLAAISIAKLIEDGNEDFIIVQSAGNGNKNRVPMDAINNGWFCSITDSSITGSQNVSISAVKDHVIIVGAVKQENNNYIISDYSNYGSQVNAFAPGDNIYSTLPGDVFAQYEFSGGYGEQSGTSMAAPMVSGICGLTWSANPSLSAKQVKEIVCSEKNTIFSVNSNPNNPNFTSSRMVNALLSVESALNYDSNKSFVFAMDLIDKNLSEIVELMGDDYQLNNQQFSTAFGSDPVLMIYNETIMPGLAVCPSYSSGIYSDIENNVNVREKIRQGSYDYDGIVVYGNGKLNDSISANMTYSDLTTIFGDFDCKGAGAEGNYFFSTEINNVNVTFCFDFNDVSDIYQYTQNGIFPSANMKIVNPKISSIAVFRNNTNSGSYSNQNDGWKKLYIDYINDNYSIYSQYTTPEYSLAKINDDDIPELFIRADKGVPKMEMKFCMIWFNNGEIGSENQEQIFIDKYSEKQGTLWGLIIHSGTHYLSYIFDGEKIETVHKADIYSGFYVDGEIVDETEFESAVSEIQKCGDKELEFKSRDSIISEINNY